VPDRQAILPEDRTRLLVHSNKFLSRRQMSVLDDSASLFVGQMHRHIVA